MNLIKMQNICLYFLYMFKELNGLDNTISNKQ